ncbi:MAG: hypothetical protein HXX12_05290 [Geothrix sp.]|uniref:hypothetical protein n=1 Tax=Geothrix sp. TaxID=1962974 RepID=UPI00184BBB70|nr:hypothetical protein [Geothrix sp.]NWJ40369.1 hypothetical protein [Geothrix sp.]WIL21626.1 MAG: hypothetical protein QOZ81_000893 [Geothrix sp.]
MIRPLLCLTALSLLAQGPPPVKKPVAELPTAPPISSNPIKELVRADLGEAETGTPEALTASLYAFISGPKDQKRSIEKIRALFHLQARLAVAAKHPEKGAFMRPMDLEAFLAFAIPQWEKGFYEKGTAVTVTKQEGIAQVWSPYEIRLEADGPALYTGTNALQCVFDGKRWWIMHLAFQSAPTEALAATLDAPRKPAADQPKK